MPKQQLKIDQFHGGLNSDSDPRDMADNELSALKGFSVSSLGRVCLLGSGTAAVADTNLTAKLDLSHATNSINEGYGLFAFNSDYDNDGALVSTNYLALYDANNGYISIYDGVNDATSWNNINNSSGDPDSDDGITTDVDRGTDAPDNTTNGTPNFYAPNGVLRYCDGTFSNDTRVPTWYGVPIKKEYAPDVLGAGGETANGGSVAIGGSWKNYDAGIEGTTFNNTHSPSSSSSANPTSNLNMHNDTADDPASTPTMEDRVLTKFDGQDTHTVTMGQANWGLGLTFNDHSQSDGSGTWQPDSSTYYKFYATMIYDGNQESHPKEFLMFGTQTDNADNGLDSTGTDGLRFYETAQDAGNTNTGVATGIKIYFKPIIRLRHGDSAGDDYVYGASSVSAVTGGNERITGGRIYWSSSEDGHDTLWCIMELDFVKGVKTFGREGSSNTSYSGWVSVGGSTPAKQNLTTFNNEGNGWSAPPKIESYFSLNGYSHKSRLNAKWKTSVVANGRVYIGNIKRQNLSTFDGGGTWSTTQADDPEYQDRICRSPVDRFDTFPEENDIEIFGANDGDSIIKLEEFADRLFIFKKQSLQILNIANDANILEGSYPYLGLDGEHQCQSVRTDHGIAWINSNSVYFYNGSNIESLIDNKIENLWKGEYGETAFWMANSDDIPTVGYDPSSKKLIVSRNISGAAGSSNEDALIYDFKIKTWTYDEDAFTADRGKTNFVVYKNEMIWAEENGSTDDIPFKRYTINTPVAQATQLYTKDFDFGAPGIRKKIYKVYVSYKGDASNVTCFYGVNGDTNTFSNFYRAGAVDANGLSASTGATSSTTPFLQSGVGTDDWVLAELKPAASINNIYSFRLGFNGSNVSADFEINDITIVYRMKNIK